MSERSALVAVLGALDTVIATTEDASERRLMQERVAELIPRYGDTGAVGWFNRAFREDAPLPTHAEAEADLTAALRGLANTRDVQVSREPAARMLPHWIVAVGAVARALPEYRPPPGVTEFDASEHPEAEWATRALMVPGVVAAMPMGQIPTADELAVARAQAIDLLGRLADRDQLPAIDAYRQFRENNRALLHSQILSQPDPCTTELVSVDDPVRPDVAVALTTSVCVAGVTLADAEQTFLKPATWDSNDAWCAMELDSHAEHPRTYLEIVDFDCNAPSAFRVAVWLEFSELVARRDSRIISYAIADGHENVAAASRLRANGAVTVDEGSIKVTRELIGGVEHLLIETTKRVAFTNPSFDESTIGILACAVGWGAMALDFVSGLLAKVAGPEEVLCVAKDNDTRTAGSAGSAGASGAKAGTTLGETLEDATGLIKQSIDDCATAFKKSFETALGAGAAPAPGEGSGGPSEGSGGHTADTLAADMSAAFARSVQAWARLLTAATSIAASVASTQPGPGGTAGTMPGSQTSPQRARRTRKTTKKKS